MLHSTMTYATILSSNYDSEARADAVSRGLSIRTIGTIQDPMGSLILTDPVTLLRIDGSPLDASHWIGSHGAGIVEPEESTEESTEDRARTLMDRALHHSYGVDALNLAEEARTLVGIKGLRSIGLAMGGDAGGYFLGALHALQGIYNSVGADPAAYDRGYEYVDDGGMIGEWA